MDPSSWVVKEKPGGFWYPEECFNGRRIWRASFAFSGHLPFVSFRRQTGGWNAGPFLPLWIQVCSLQQCGKVVIDFAIGGDAITPQIIYPPSRFIWTLEISYHLTTRVALHPNACLSRTCVLSHVWGFFCNNLPCPSTSFSNGQRKGSRQTTKSSGRNIRRRLLLQALWNLGWGASTKFVDAKILGIPFKCHALLWGIPRGFVLFSSN